jgi:hypothetical protein
MSLRSLPAVVLALVISSWSGAVAQSLSMGGFVVDPSGAVVPNAPVQLHAESGATVTQTKSDASRSFRIVGLHSGDYLVTVPAFSSFADRTLPVHLSTTVTNLRVALSLAAVNEQVTVSTGQSLSTEPAENTNTVAVSSTELRKLPAVDLDYVAALSALLDASSVGSGGTTLVVDGIEMKPVAVAPLCNPGGPNEQ